MQKNIFPSLILAGFGWSTILAHAESSTLLAETTVTAARTEIASDELATAVNVFNRADIERLQVRTLPELLNRAVGVDVTQNGGMGKSSSLFMRGTSSDHILVLIDGIKTGSVTLGTAPYEILPIDQIERVEISRGPNSSMYGSEAIGGVIQIFTRKGAQTEQPSISLDAGAGSYDTAQTNGVISGKWRDSWYSVSASHLTTQGFNAMTNDDPDRDGYDNTGLNARIGHKFNDKAEVDAFYFWSNGTSDVDHYQKRSRFTNQVVGVNGSLEVNDFWRSSLRLGQSRDDSFNLAVDPSYDSYFYSTRWNASWQNELRFNAKHKMVLGADYRLDQVDSITTYTKSSRYDFGLFGEWHGQLWDHHFLTTSLRWDENQAIGDYVTGNIGWRYNWLSGVSLFASFGNGFKAPSLNDLYYIDPWGSHGNPSLKPEQSRSFEVGLSGRQEWANWQLRAYHTDIDNLITWYTDKNTYISVPLQTQKAQIQGIEAELSREFWGWQNKLALQLLQPIDKSTRLLLPRRADTIITYDLSHSWDKLDVGGNILVRGASYEEDWLANRKQVAGFATVDLRAVYHLNKQWSFSGKLNNLLDKDYQTVDTYNNAGRNFFFSIHYNN